VTDHNSSSPTTKTFKKDRDLRAIFLYYCDKKSHGMSCKSFLKFAGDVKAIQSVPASRVQLCFTAATRQYEFDRTSNCKHDQSHLDFTQWRGAASALIGCMDPPVDTTEVLAKAKKMKTTDVDKHKVDNADVDQLMHRHCWTLKLLYDHYSSIKSTTKPGAFCMNASDYASFLRDFSLMGGSSPVCTKNLSLIFKKVKNMASDFEMEYISFSQFIECLGRTALVLFPSGSAPSSQLQANKATAYFNGETPTSINYVQRYLSRTNHFRSIQYSPRSKPKDVTHKSAQLIQGPLKSDEVKLPRMPSRPARRGKSKRRIRVVSRRIPAPIERMPDRSETTAHFSSVHISSHEAEAGIRTMKLPAI